jgi:hypothetical protein
LDFPHQAAVVYQVELQVEMVLWLDLVAPATEVVVEEVNLLGQLEMHQPQVIEAWAVQVETVFRFRYLVLHTEEEVVVVLVLIRHPLVLCLLVAQGGREVVELVEMAAILARDL